MNQHSMNQPGTNRPGKNRLALHRVRHQRGGRVPDDFQSLSRLRKDCPDDGVRFDGAGQVDDPIINGGRDRVADATLPKGTQSFASCDAAPDLDVRTDLDITGTA